MKGGRFGKWKLKSLPPTSSFRLPTHQRADSPTSDTAALIVDPTVQPARHDLERFDTMGFYKQGAKHDVGVQDDDEEKRSLVKKKKSVVMHYKKHGFRSTLLFLLPVHGKMGRDAGHPFAVLTEDQAKQLPLHHQHHPPADAYRSPTPMMSDRATPMSQRAPTPMSASQGWPFGPSMQHPPAEKGQRIPLFSYIFALMAGILLIYGFIQFKNEYSAVLSLSPFNIYLGVNAQTLVRTGALFPPCMRASLELTPSQSYPCANASGSMLTAPSWVYEIPMTGGGTCQLENVCGLTPFKSAQAPDQAFRFLTALLTSGGVFQYVINMLFLLSYGAMVERQMGTLRYIYIFIVSGTFGYCFGSVFIHDNVALMGCLVPIFGLAGASLMDGFRSWQSTLYPGSPILRFLLVIVLGVIVGYLPGYNNFCHLGGLMGGILAQWSIWSSQAKFLEQRVRWLMMMAFRLIALVALIVLFYEVLSNFYTNHSWSQGCNWCQFVSCLPFYNTCSSL